MVTKVLYSLAMANSCFLSASQCKGYAQQWDSETGAEAASDFALISAFTASFKFVQAVAEAHP